jgi:predicted HTH domain antitoxin
VQTLALTIELPDELANSQPDVDALLQQAEARAREALLVKLYDLGQITTGRAARILDISRREFLDLLGQYGVSEFDENMDIATEARRGF